MKKKGIIVLAACVLLLSIVVIAFDGGGKKPYKDLDAAQIASATYTCLRRTKQFKSPKLKNWWNI